MMGLDDILKIEPTDEEVASVRLEMAQTKVRLNHVRTRILGEITRVETESGLEADSIHMNPVDYSVLRRYGNELQFEPEGQLSVIRSGQFGTIFTGHIEGTIRVIVRNARELKTPMVFPKTPAGVAFPAEERDK